MFQQIAQKVAELPARVKQTSAVIAALVGLVSCETPQPHPTGQYRGNQYQNAPVAIPFDQASFPQTSFGGQGIVTQNSSNFSSTGFSNRRTVDYGNRIVTTNNRTSTRGFSNTTHTYDPITGASSTFNFSVDRNGTPRFNVSTWSPRNTAVNPAAIYRAEYQNALRKQQAAQRAAIQRAARAYYNNN